MNINWLTALSATPQHSETIADICERSLDPADHAEYLENVESKLFANWLADELIPSIL